MFMFVTDIFQPQRRGGNAFIVSDSLVLLMAVRLSPSLLAWLRCFEATARHASFTRAAAELCITQGAVSQQVKALEQWLGRPLLLRTPRHLVPTPEGQWLGVVLREGFDAIESTLARLRQAPEPGPATLSCSPSFAMRWLTPRMGSFMAQHPEVGLRVYGEFHSLDRSRMVHDGVEVAVRFDLGGYRDLRAHEFLDEWLIPVASPGFVAGHPDLHPARLDPAWLLHDVSPWEGAGEFEEWTHWMQAAGVKVPAFEAGHRFNLSQLALGAAVAGQGIAMGRAALMLDDVRNGLLLPLFGLSVASRASYHFVSQPSPSAQTLLIEDWLNQEAELFRHRRAEVLPAPQ